MVSKPVAVGSTFRSLSPFIFACILNVRGNCFLLAGCSFFSLATRFFSSFFFVFLYFFGIILIFTTVSISHLLCSFLPTPAIAAFSHHTDGDGHINFEEFLNGISLMCETGDFKKKVEFSFQVYDVDGDGAISKAELTDMLKADIVEMSLDMNQEEIDILIDATMKQVSAGADTISMDQYMTYAEANRDKFQAEMTVNVKRRLIGAH